MDIVEAMNWRYAVKKFDPEKKLSKTQVDSLLESLRLSPSSFGLQPWHFLLIEDPELRESLVADSYGQRQVADASTLVVFCRVANFGETEVKKFVQSTADARKQEVSSLAKFEEMLLNFISSKDSESLKVWSDQQIYLALGNLLSFCAVEKIDSCPIAGFNPKAFDEKLGLEQKGLESVVICPIGYRDHSDKYANTTKVRYSLEEVVTRI